MWIISQHGWCIQAVPGDARLYGRTPQQMSILHWDFFFPKEHAIASLCELNMIKWVEKSD